MLSTLPSASRGAVWHARQCRKLRQSIKALHDVVWDLAEVVERVADAIYPADGIAKVMSSGCIP
jgi:hypothetical protein